MSEQPKKRQRLAQDIAGKLRDELEENPRNVEAWKKLISEYKTKDKSDELQECYEKLVKLFPCSGNVWNEYIEYVLSHADFQKAEKLFSRCLATSTDSKLWETYLGYVRRTNPTTGNDPSAAYTVIAEAYEYAISRIQYDRQSGPIFQAYLQFLEKRPASTTWEQHHKMDVMRNVYRKAVGLPISNIEQLWRAYNQFENNISRSTARKFIDERSGAYMIARSCFRESETFNQGLIRTGLPAGRKFNNDERDQLGRWRRLISWEVGNPLQLRDEEELKARVLFTYRQALVSMCYYPELWYDAVEYCLRAGLQSEAIDLLVTSLSINQLSFTLTVRLSDLYERMERRDDASKTYRKLIDLLKEQAGGDRDLAERMTLAYVELMQVVKRGNGVKESRKISSECRKLPFCTYHIYTASAAIEYQNKEPGIAAKIYEIAYKKYREDPRFIKCYLKFLFQAGDLTNARAVFEKALSDVGPQNARPIYDQFLSYEAAYADAAALYKLEDRYRELYPDVDLIDLTARRFRQNEADPFQAELRLKEPEPVNIKVPESVMVFLKKLPPSNQYDGPSINLDKLLDMITAN